MDSADVNQYIRAIAGQEFTAKDFRTWAGTILAARELYAAGPGRNLTDGKKIIVKTVKSVAKQLGNRAATCRKYYVHPAILDAYTDGTLFSTMQQGELQQSAYAGLGLRPEEYCIMVVVAAHQERLAGKAPATAA